MPAAAIHTAPSTSNSVAVVEEYGLNFHILQKPVVEKVGKTAVQRFTFQVEFNPKPAGGLYDESRNVTEITAESTNLEGALKALHAIGEYFKSAKNPSEFHEKREALRRTHFTPVNKKEDGSYDIAITERRGDRYVASKPTVHVAKSDANTLCEYANAMQKSWQLSSTGSVSHPEVLATKRSHVRADTRNRAVFEIRSTKMQLPCVITGGNSNPRARVTTEDHNKYKETLKEMLKEEGRGALNNDKGRASIAFYRGDQGVRVQDRVEDSGNDDRTDVFGNYYETSEAFTVECLSYQGPDSEQPTVKTDLHFTNAKAAHEAQKFKAGPIQALYQVLTAVEAEMLTETLSKSSSADEKLEELKAMGQALNIQAFVVPYFEEHSEMLELENLAQREDFETSYAQDAMQKVLISKFAQGTKELDLLLATEDAALIHHKPTSAKDETVFSDGGEGSGGNLLGKYLELIRNHAQRGLEEPIDLTNTSAVESGIVTSYNPL